jgi:hypothetical protein
MITIRNMNMSLLKCRAKRRDGRECGYEWEPRAAGVEPKECPECKSRKWRGTGEGAGEPEGGAEDGGAIKPEQEGELVAPEEDCEVPFIEEEPVRALAPSAEPEFVEKRSLDMTAFNDTPVRGKRR